MSKSSRPSISYTLVAEKSETWEIKKAPFGALEFRLVSRSGIALALFLPHG